MGGFTDDGTVSQAIARLQPARVIGDEAAQKVASNLIDRAVTDIQNGMSGADVLRNIEQLRKEARDIRKGTDLGPEKMAMAKVREGISRELEGLIDQNLQRQSESNPALGRLLEQYKKDRTTQAKTYTLEDIFNENTGKVDMGKLAKLTAEDNALTGPFADLGKVAGVFPESFHSGGPLSTIQRHLARSGVPAAIGMGVGTVLAPGMGTLGGAVAGAGLGEMASVLGARRIASPSYQGKNAIPVDTRPMRQALGYEKTPIGPEPLSLAPVGEPLVQPTPQGPMPQGRGLLNLAEQESTQQPALRQMPVVDIPIEARLRPLYERGGVQQEPQVPPVRTHNGTIDFVQEQPVGLTKYGIPEAPTKLGYEGQPLSEGVAAPMLPQAEVATALRSLITDEGAALPTAPGMVNPNSALGLPTVRNQRTPRGGPTPSMWNRAAKGERVIPQESQLMSLEEMTAEAVRNRASTERQPVDFMGKTEFWQQSAMKQATEAFIQRAAELRSIIDNKYPIDGRKQAAAAMELQALEREFGAGAKLGGLRGKSDAYTSVYQAGDTQLPIQKTFDPRIAEAILGRK